MLCGAGQRRANRRADRIGTALELACCARCSFRRRCRRRRCRGRRNVSGVGFYLRKPGHHELGWLRRCACCRELGPRAELPSAERSLWLGNTIYALFCTSDRCEAAVRLELRKMFGELAKPAELGALPHCALCSRHGHCMTVRFGEDVIAWVCGLCREVADARLAAAWPDALPYTDGEGHVIERPLLDRPVRDRKRLAVLAGQPYPRRHAWTRGVVWLPEDVTARPHRLCWHLQTIFRPFTLLLWSGDDHLEVRQLRVNREPQLISDSGISWTVFRAPLPIEKFRELVTASAAAGELPTIEPGNWDRLLLEGGDVQYLELPTIEVGGSLDLELSGAYQHGCILGRCLTNERAMLLEQAELERVASDSEEVTEDVTIGGEYSPAITGGIV